MEKFETGAVREELKYRYDLIPPEIYQTLFVTKSMLILGEKVAFVLKVDCSAARILDLARYLVNYNDFVLFSHLASTFHEGALKYGDRNWELGIPISNCINHALRHITLDLKGDNSEPHLAHAVTNLCMAYTLMQRKGEATDVEDIHKDRCDITCKYNISGVCSSESKCLSKI